MEFTTVKSKHSKGQQQRLRTSVPPTQEPIQSISKLFDRSLGNRVLQSLYRSESIQHKLKIGQPDDKYEQEADRVAEQVMRMPEPRLPSSVGDSSLANSPIPRSESIQRACASCLKDQKAVENESRFSREEGLIQTKQITQLISKKTTTDATPEVTPEINSGIQSLQGGGQPLQDPERAFFEPRLGIDLSGVRLHKNQRSAQAAESLGARAFAVGQHIYFAREAFSSQGGGSRKLLAHELVHTLQQGADRRIARQCRDAWSAIPVPAGVSSATANIAIDLGQLQITDNVSVSPVVGQVHVKFILPRALQESIAPSALGGLLQRMQVTIDLSGQLSTAGGTSAGARFPNNELCLVVTFSQAEEGAWQSNIRILAGTQLELPLNIGSGTPLRASPVSALGVGISRINLRLLEDLTTSAGALRIAGMNDFRAVWSGIISQVKNSLQVPISNIRVPLDARLRAALSVPLPVPGGELGAGSPLLVHTTGDVRLRTDLSSEAGRYKLRLSGQASGAALGGLVSLELSGRGRLRGSLPSQVRLGDLSTEFFSNLLAQSTGGGEIQGRFRAFGLPGRIDADFRLIEGRLVGNASFLSPVGLGRGRFRYGLNEGLSAEMGMLGLVNLTIAPAQERINAEARRGIGPQPFDFGTSVTGLGATGVALTPRSTAILSLGAGPQFISTPRGDTEIGVFGGIDFTLRFLGP